MNEIRTGAVCGGPQLSFCCQHQSNDALRSLFATRFNSFRVHPEYIAGFFHLRTAAPVELLGTSLGNWYGNL